MKSFFRGASFVAVTRRYRPLVPAGSVCGATPGFGTSVASKAATVAIPEANPGSFETSTRYRTGNPKPAPMPLKVSWQGRSTMSRILRSAPRSICTHLSATGTGEIAAW